MNATAPNSNTADYVGDTATFQYDAGYRARELNQPDDKAQPKLWRLGWMEADKAIRQLRMGHK